MSRFFRFSPSRLALVYIGLGVLALALFAVLLWYAWRANLATFREYVGGEQTQKFSETFDRQGAEGLSAAIAARLKNLPRDEIIVFADPAKQRLAGDLNAWPPQIPEAPGTYGLVIALGGGSSMRVVASHVILPGGYHLLLGRESVRFESLVERFWYGITGAIVAVLLLGGLIGWLSHRALLNDVNEISRTALAISKGNLSRRVATRGGSDELDNLAQTVNGMLEQLAAQNVQLESEIGVRRQAEHALHRAHEDLESLVAERTAQLARTNESLRRNEAYLAEAQRLSHTGTFAWVVSNGDIFWSEETYRIFEYDRAIQPTVELVLQRTYPDDRALVRQLIDRVSQQRKAFDFEHRLLMPNGSVKYVRVVGHPSVEDKSGNFEFVGAITDITERKRAEQRLRTQYTVTQLLAEATTIEEVTPKILQTVCEFLLWDLGALWSLDRQASVLRCVEVWHKESVKVPQFEAVTRERTLRTGVGLPGRVWSRHEPAYIPDVTKDANFPRGPIAEREGLHAAFAFPILLGGDVLGVMEFFSREIRQPEQELLNMMATLGSQVGQFIERKRAEQAVLSAQMELAHVARVATLGELTASIAHEVNQPLAAIANNASACLNWLKGNNMEEARTSIEMICADGHRAGEIIGRIRALVKKAPTQKDWLDINQTIREVVALAHSELQRNSIALETRLSDAVQPLVFADRIQLQQVILNLIMNAVEAMSEMSDGRRQLLIRTDTDESESITVTVQDSGPGVKPEDLHRLFTPFYTTKPQGMGMGLAICRSIIEAHGGKLRVMVNEARGATFQFTLPTGHGRTAAVE
jgi:C4-dicarboxylate-specific signal transduction histidine kinase